MTINGWLRDFLWSQSSQVIQSYGSSNSAYGLMFLGAHFVWAFSLMFLFSGRGYWQELIESIIWAHQMVATAPVWDSSILGGIFDFQWFLRCSRSRNSQFVVSPTVA